MDNNEDLLVSGHAFKEMLSHISLDKKMEQLRKDYKDAKSISKKDILMKQMKYVNGLKNTGLSPKEAFVISHMPVIPPEMRPATVMGGNRIEFADVNNLYRDHMTINGSLKDNVNLLPPEMLINERAEAYAGVKAIVGLGEAISPNSRGRSVKGLLRQVAGEGGPKTGLFHSKILSKKQDFSGRATIYAEPNLGFNEAAVPKDMLWDMYKFHMLRDLSKQGYDYVSSERAWNERTPSAETSFNKVIKQVPVLINRAPTLMKSNVTAVYPVAIKGTAMGINPIHLPLFSGDFDGDALSLYLPMSPEAVEEAKKKILPEHQIHDYRKGMNQSLVSPAHEAILGSMHLTDPDMTQEVVKFKTEQEALAALKAGTIKENTPIQIG
jgi:DNA-directed RNA polymerase subunit beta'